MSAYKSYLMGIVTLAFLSVFAVMAAPINTEVCIKSTGNKTKDHIIASTVAKGQLAHELGGSVSATSTLKTITTETQKSVETKDILMDEVTLSSKHKLNNVQTLSKGYRTIDNQSHYCVQLGL